MKKVENKYNQGKIYKLVSFQTNNVYIGSTAVSYLSNRLAKHRSNYNSFQIGKGHYVTSYELLKYDDVDIILIENYACQTKQELHARERYWIENTQNCVNKFIPTRTSYEYERSDTRRQTRKVRDANRQDQKADYYQLHKDQLLTRQKVYREANKDAINARRRLQRAQKKNDG